MNTTKSSLENGQEWLRRWDQMQTNYFPEREKRFQVMLDLLDVLFPGSFVAVDLACGPGSLSQRLLVRFPRANCIAVDLDPVLLTLGRSVLGEMQGRLRWSELDIREPGWHNRLGETQVDAVLSTTALHWLPPETLVSVYQELAALIRAGGVFLNGDHLGFVPHLPTFRLVAATMRDRREAQAFGQVERENWRQWWDALQGEPGMQDLFAERERRFAWRPFDDPEPILALHEAALQQAGFHEVGVIWQNLDNRVLMAVR